MRIQARRLGWPSFAALSFLRAFLWMYSIWKIAFRTRKHAKAGGRMPRSLDAVGIVVPHSEVVRWELTRIAQAVLWSSSFGVEEVTLYDPSGELKRHKDELIKRICKVSEDEDPVLGGIRCKCFLEKFDGLRSDPSQIREEPYIDELHYLPMGITEQVLKLNIISEVDSYRSLIDATMVLAHGSRKGRKTGPKVHVDAERLEGLTAEALDRELRYLDSYLSDPQLIIILGEVATLAGYPPWSVQTSEIYCMGNMNHLKKKHVANAVNRYFSTKQRFGK